MVFLALCDTVSLTRSVIRDPLVDNGVVDIYCARPHRAGAGVALEPEAALVDLRSGHRRHDGQVVPQRALSYGRYRFSIHFIYI